MHARLAVLTVAAAAKRAYALAVPAHAVAAQTAKHAAHHRPQAPNAPAVPSKAVCVRCSTAGEPRALARGFLCAMFNSRRAACVSTRVLVCDVHQPASRVRQHAGSRVRCSASRCVSTRLCDHAACHSCAMSWVIRARTRLLTQAARHYARLAIIMRLAITRGSPLLAAHHCAQSAASQGFKSMAT